MVTTSGSGLDPDITPDNAYYQAPRVAKARGLTEDAVRKLIEQHTTAAPIGIFGRTAGERAGAEPGSRPDFEIGFERGFPKPLSGMG